MNKCLTFFKRQVGSVEILRNGKLNKCYFQIPFVCNFITENIRNHLIKEANRNSDQERINFFFQNVKGYKKEMLHRQKYAGRKLYQLLYKWRSIKFPAYLFILFINYNILMTNFQFEGTKYNLWIQNPIEFTYQKFFDQVYSLIIPL